MKINYLLILIFCLGAFSAINDPQYSNGSITIYQSFGSTVIDNYARGSIWVRHDATISTGSIKYVAKTGNNSVTYENNSISSPWLTIQHGLNTIQSGDTLSIAAGDYHEYDTIKISNVVVQGPGEPSLAHVNLNSVFDTLNPSYGGTDSINNAVQHGFWFYGKNNVTIRNFEITKVSDLTLAPSLFWFLTDTNITITHNFIHEPNSSNHQKPTCGSQFYTNGTNFWCKNVIIRHNTIWRYTGIGVQCMGDGWIVDSNNISHGVGWNTSTGVKYEDGDEDAIRFFGANHLIQNNWIHDCTDAEATGHIDAFQAFSIGPSIQWAKHITINHNFINNFNDCFMAQDQGESDSCTAHPAWCDSMGAIDTIHNYNYDFTFSNNVVANQPAGSYWAIDIADYFDHCTIRNNLFTNAGEISIVVCCNATHVICENNVVRSPSSYGCSIYNLTPKFESIWDYNAYLPDFTWPTKISGYDVHSLFGIDLKFVDSSNVLGADGLPFTADDGFNLTSTSPLRGSGVDGVDMGPYPYVSGTSYTATNGHRGIALTITPSLKSAVDSFKVLSSDTLDSLVFVLSGDTTLVLRKCSAGSFSQGSSEHGQDSIDWSYCNWNPSCDKPAHTVNIKYNYFMGKYEVTQGQWSALRRHNPVSDSISGPDWIGSTKPVCYVTWHNCFDFCQSLSNLGKGRFRLPSESEWEYACRAGTTTRFFFGNSTCNPATADPCELNDYAWWGGNTSKYMNVGQKLPNPWGLYDTYGNVYEWCADNAGSIGAAGPYDGAPTDGSAWMAADTNWRILRGAWYSYTLALRYTSYFRGCHQNHNDEWPLGWSHLSTGFRVCRDQDTLPPGLSLNKTTGIISGTPTFPKDTTNYKIIVFYSNTSKDTVTVKLSVDTVSNPAKVLTAFSFTSPAATGTINEAAKTVAVTVPFGTVVTALIATFTSTGASVKVGSTVQTSGVTANNFTNPVTYTVVAVDESTQDYVVTVTVAPNPAKALTAFSFTSPAATGTINEAAKTVAVTVPYGTNVTALIATFTSTGASVKIGSTVQTSGVTANNFTNPATYTVVAADASTQDYVVTVTISKKKWFINIIR
jgi:formylglycine-generating enzyme required for sulfatase activity